MALAGGTAVAPAVAAPSWRVQERPVIRLYAPDTHEQIGIFGNSAEPIDPDIYVEALDAALQFDVQRAGYAHPITMRQIIAVRGGGHVSRPLRSSAIDGWNGLRRFFKVTLTTRAGKVLKWKVLSFCPDGYPSRATPESPASSPFPTQCNSSTPFVLGTVWGLQRGWGVEALQSQYTSNGYAGLSARLQAGKNYVVKVSIMPAWRSILHITARNATTLVHLKAVTFNQCQECIFTARPQHQAAHAAPTAQPARAPAALRDARLVASPPRSVLPDLVPLPSWGISVQNLKATKTRAASAQISFGATVAVLGNGPLDVEGFSTHHSLTMPAYQYFWRGTHLVGRARAGTMFYDNEHGHHHWHFQQFAEYRLLGAGQKLVLRSRKVGFCIAPTDAVDLLIRHAVMQPAYTGFTGECGVPGSLWVSETMPLGWADTYFQTVAGQSFNVTGLRNGVYYIEIIANPEHVLHETDTRNDVSLRKIVIGGKPGHRTVYVPPYHGIDREH